MLTLFYIRLFAFTAGTLVYLFLLALILGHRRPRKFERLLFFLVLSLFLIYAGGLLEINARIQYGSPPDVTQIFYTSLTALGIVFLLPLVVQTHLEYFRQVRNASVAWWVLALSYSLYLIPTAMVVLAAQIANTHPKLGFIGFLNTLVRQSGAIVISSAMVASLLEFWLSRSTNEPAERSMFRWLAGGSLIVALWPLVAIPDGILPMVVSDNLFAAISVVGVFPGALLIHYSLLGRFLEFGSQRNLVYALSATFLALLYLALVRRVSGWLEPALPPEATAAILIFVLIFLFEPLERVIGPALHRRFHERVGHLQQLTVELQQEARHGDLARLVAFAEHRIREKFGLAAVRLSIPRDTSQKALEAPGGLGHAVQIPLLKDGKEIGLLEAASTGTFLTGETTASLEFMAEQLPAMIDLSRLIEEKLRLERELAERERLALLGQMAASVSHNLRNPLSSMKTVLQVQLENPDLPFDLRHDCALVVDEIDRMSAKLTQLLRFAKPSVNGQRVAAVALAKQTAALFGRDAERRNVRLEFECPPDEISVLASEDALSEVLSNLIVNAIEAQPNGGRLRLTLARSADRLEIVVEDDGPGISADLRAKMFQPYFTTKATGTGLGLSIVARRVSEMGGTLACESPARDGKGTRFRLSLPIAAGESG
ncbi:MAG: ATP-binding protein [Candidatus Acidiferrales bacterium]